jgi:GntR family transcriptional regulator, rspAB operon transcriptional repressor
METLSQKVFESLKVNILNFTYLPGLRLSDDEIATELRVSRTPVREALNRLSELGLVEAKSMRGFRVKSFSEKEIEDLYILRATLECLAVKLTIGRMNPEIEKQLKVSLADYPHIIKSGDLWRFNLADTKFHDMIAQLSGNTAVCEMLRNLYDKIQVIRRFDHLRAGSLERTYQEHLQILESMVKRDVKKSEKSMSKHILYSMKIILKIKQQKI